MAGKYTLLCRATVIRITKRSEMPISIGMPSDSYREQKHVEAIRTAGRQRGYGN